jgi:hypothetical protein
VDEHKRITEAGERVCLGHYVKDNAVTRCLGNHRNRNQWVYRVDREYDLPNPPLWAKDDWLFRDAHSSLAEITSFTLMDGEFLMLMSDGLYCPTREASCVATTAAASKPDTPECEMPTTAGLGDIGTMKPDENKLEQVKGEAPSGETTKGQDETEDKGKPPTLAATAARRAITDPDLLARVTQAFANRTHMVNRNPETVADDLTSVATDMFHSEEHHDDQTAVLIFAGPARERWCGFPPKPGAPCELDPTRGFRFVGFEMYYPPDGLAARLASLQELELEGEIPREALYIPPSAVTVDLPPKRLPKMLRNKRKTIT